MCTTKEKILLTAIKLFAQDGYEAVSISKISGELGMAKSALYKHYKNKRDIFDSIINRMDELDYERAREYNMPDGNMDEIIKEYRNISTIKSEFIQKHNLNIGRKKNFHLYSEECLL